MHYAPHRAGGPHVSRNADLPIADAELKQLVAAMCDGTIASDERDRLQVRLAADSPAMAYYIGYLDLHAQLQWHCRGDGAVNFVQLPATKLPIFVRMRNAVMRPTPFSLTMASLVMGLLITALAFISPPIYRAVSRAGDVVAPTVVAEVSRTSAAVWKPERPADAPAHMLMVGEEVELVSGLAEIQFHRGVRVILEGPAVLRIAGDNAAALDRGKLVARVAETAHGFEVLTPFAKVRDLGTEFAVAVANKGATDLHVFQGKVEVLPANVSGISDGSKYLVIAGERLEIPETGIAARGNSVDGSALFVRRMPPQTNELLISNEYVEAILAAKPAIYWRFEKTAENRVVNELSVDYPLEVVGGVRLLPSHEANNSAVFGASKQTHYMICRDAKMFSGPEYTVEFWCQPYSFGQPMMTMLGVGRDTIVDSHLLAIVGKGKGATATGAVRYLHRSPSGNAGGSDVYSPPSLTIGAWHHIVSVYDQGTMHLYVNGVAATSTASAPLQADAQTILLGTLQTKSKVRPFVGRLDEVAIYDRALDADEVSKHHEIGNRGQ
jgi:hypothetical protein